jgi:Zn-finger nucleic acid-binding protein
MECPQCTKVNLVMADRQGIEIDYCPQCRGVWLDRGELDKLIERNAARPDDERDWQSSAERERMMKSRKRRGVLGELFDFD